MFVSGFCPHCECFFEIDSSVIEASHGHANCIQCSQTFFVPKNISRGFLPYTNEDLASKTPGPLPIIGNILEAEEEQSPIEESLDKILLNKTGVFPTFNNSLVFKTTAEVARPDMLGIYGHKDNWTNNFDEPSTFSLASEQKDENSFTNPEAFYSLSDKPITSLVPYNPPVEIVEPIKTEPNQAVFSPTDIQPKITEPEITSSKTEENKLEYTFFIEKPTNTIYAPTDSSYFAENFYSKLGYEFEPPSIKLKNLKTEPDIELVEPVILPTPSTTAPEQSFTEPNIYLPDTNPHYEEEEEELVPIYKDFIAGDKLAVKAEPLASYTQEEPIYTQTTPQMSTPTLTAEAHGITDETLQRPLKTSATQPVGRTIPISALSQAIPKSETNIANYEDYLPNFITSQKEKAPYKTYEAESLDMGEPFEQEMEEKQPEPLLAPEEEEEEDDYEDEIHYSPPPPYIPPQPQLPIQQFFYMLPYGQQPSMGGLPPTQNYPEKYTEYDEDEEYDDYTPRASKLRSFVIYILAACLFAALGYFLIGR